MNIRRLFIDFYYSRPRRWTVFFILAVIAMVVLLPIFRNRRRFSSRYNTEEIDDSGLDPNEESLKLPLTSLEMSGNKFILKGRPFTILSGSIHYFRVVQQYWDDRLAKLKAMGLNTVMTCIPWSIHEEFKEFIKFDDPEYDIVTFVRKAHKLGVYVIIRVGPYVGAQMDFGGLPSWLIEEVGTNIRSSNPYFLSLVERYFKKLFATLTPYQFSNGGPIIAWQVESEYASKGHDISYIQALQKMMLDNGVKEVIFTSDELTSLVHNPMEISGILKGLSLPYLTNEKDSIEELEKLQPGKPLFVTELWVGHHDSWGDEHHTQIVKDLVESVATMLDMGASINFYMFHGGTNLGFINGANNGENHRFSPILTSFEFDAPLNEAGDVTHKYKELRKTLRASAQKNHLPRVRLDIPPNIQRKVYEPVYMNHHVPLAKMFKHVNQAIQIKSIIPMEKFKINSNGGQSYGYAVYRTKIPHGAKKLYIEKFRDWAQVVVGSELVATLDAFDPGKQTFDVGKMIFREVNLKYTDVNNDEPLYLDILVENLGRGYVTLMDHPHKGLIGDVRVDGVSPESWTVYPLSFSKSSPASLFKQDAWDSLFEQEHDMIYPGFFKGAFYLTSKPRDTYINMSEWGKGVVFLNDQVVGRYWNVGPHQTLFVPSIWFVPGENTIVILEFMKRSDDGLVRFTKDAIVDKLRDEV